MRRAVAQVTRELSEVAEVYVFGGLLRDLTLYGGCGFESDVDLVVVPRESSSIASIIKKFDFQKNKFGGFRLSSDRWLFDVWEFEKTWAFSEKYIEAKSQHSLIETTFFNWDAVFYDIRSNKIICGDQYFNEISNLTLNINLEENPNVMGAFLRALRFIEKDQAKTAPKLTKFISGMFEGETDSDILLYDREHSKSPFLSADSLRRLRRKAKDWEGEDRYHWDKQSQLEMFS